ncbi:hypothetical protein D3C79_925460 [compost metagenome]
MLADGLQRTDDLQRFTSLRARLNPMDIVEKVAEIKTVSVKIDEQPIKDVKLTVETEAIIHPMIGMDGVSPYDFLDD